MQESRSRGNTAGTGRRACPKYTGAYAPRPGTCAHCSGWRPKRMSGSILEAGSEPHAKCLEEEPKPWQERSVQLSGPVRAIAGPATRRTRLVNGAKPQEPRPGVSTIRADLCPLPRQKQARRNTRRNGMWARRSLKDATPPDAPEQTCEGSNPMSAGGSKTPAQAASKTSAAGTKRDREEPGHE